MSSRSGFFRSGLFLLILPLWALAGGPASMGNAFTYQGKLVFEAQPVNDTCDFSFRLWDDLMGGSNLGVQHDLTATVNEGTFTVEVPGWDPSLFNGQPRWVELDVRCPSGSGDFTTLTPRQRLNASPYALVSSSVSGGSVTTDSLTVNGSGTVNGNMTVTGNLTGRVMGGGTLNCSGDSQFRRSCNIWGQATCQPTSACSGFACLDGSAQAISVSQCFNVTDGSNAVCYNYLCVE